jgi:hypothetical protein
MGSANREAPAIEHFLSASAATLLQVRSQVQEIREFGESVLLLHRLRRSPVRRSDGIERVALCRRRPWLAPASLVASSPVDRRSPTAGRAAIPQALAPSLAKASEAVLGGCAHPLGPPQLACHRRDLDRFDPRKCLEGGHDLRSHLE